MKIMRQVRTTTMERRLAADRLIKAVQTISDQAEPVARVLKVVRKVRTLREKQAAKAVVVAPA